MKHFTLHAPVFLCAVFFTQATFAKETVTELGEHFVFEDTLPSLAWTDFLCEKGGKPCRYQIKSVALNNNVRHVNAQSTVVTKKDPVLGDCLAQYQFVTRNDKGLGLMIHHDCNYKSTRESLEWAIQQMPPDLSVLVDRVEESGLKSSKEAEIVSETVTVIPDFADFECDQYDGCKMLIPSIVLDSSFRRFGDSQVFSHLDFFSDASPWNAKFKIDGKEYEGTLYLFWDAKRQLNLRFRTHWSSVGHSRAKMEEVLKAGLAALPASFTFTIDRAKPL